MKNKKFTEYNYQSPSADRDRPSMSEYIQSKRLGVSCNVNYEYFGSRLTYASFIGTTDEIRELIQTGVPINAQYDYGYTPLHSAAAWGQMDAVITLANAGADSNIKNVFGETPAETAYANGHSNIGNILQAYALSKESKNYISHEVADSERFSAENKVRLVSLIEKYSKYWPFSSLSMVDPNQTTLDGGTLLHLVSDVGSALEVECLLSVGSNPNSSDELGYTPLHSSSAWGRPAAIQALIFAGANSSLVTNEGLTAMQIAIRNKHIGVVDILNGNRDTEAALTSIRNTESADVPLQKFVMKYSQHVVAPDSIIVDPNQSFDGSESLLHFVAFSGSLEDVQTLIAHGACIDCIGDMGSTPLHNAAMNGQVLIVKLLTDSGADPTIIDEFGNSARDWAVQNEHWEIVSLLLKIENHYAQDGNKLGF